MAGRGRRGPAPAGCGRRRWRCGAAGRSRSGPPAPAPRPAAAASPPCAPSTTEPGARPRPRRRSAPRGRHLDQPALAHLEDADLVGRAEAVLERRAGCGRCRSRSPSKWSTQSTRCSSTRGPGQRPLLGDVTDQEQRRRRSRLAVVQQRGGRLPDLRRRGPGAASRDRRSVCTESITHAVGPLRLERRQHGLERGLGEHRHRQRAPRRAARPAAGPAPPTPRRRRRARRSPAPAMLASAIPRQRALADPGRAAEQHQRAGDQPAAQHPVELGDPGAEPR